MQNYLNYLHYTSLRYTALPGITLHYITLHYLKLQLQAPYTLRTILRTQVVARASRSAVFSWHKICILPHAIFLAYIFWHSFFPTFYPANCLAFYPAHVLVVARSKSGKSETKRQLRKWVASQTRCVETFRLNWQWSSEAQALAPKAYHKRGSPGRKCGHNKP